MDNEKKQVTYNSSFSGETQVTLDIQQYMNNKAMYIGLMCNEDGYEEPFGDVTVNLSFAAPNYCGYLNVNVQTEDGEKPDTLSEDVLYEVHMTVEDGGDFDLSETEKEIKISAVLGI